MPQVKVLELGGAAFEISQVPDLIRAEFAHGPDCSLPCYFVEPLRIVNTGDDLIVIAPNHAPTVRSRPLQNRRRVRIISDQVSTTDDLLILIPGVCQDSLKSIQICMKVAQDQDLHRRIRLMFGGVALPRALEDTLATL